MHKGYHDDSAERHAGLVFYAAVVGGVACGLIGPIAVLQAWTAALASLSVALVTPPRVHVRNACLVFAIGAVAIAIGASARDRALNPPLATLVGDGRSTAPVTVAGRLVRDAELTGEGARLTLDVRALLDNGTWRGIEGRAQVFIGGSFVAGLVPALTAGREVRAPISLRAPQIWLNPGGPSATWQALTRRFDVLGSVKSAALVTVERGGWWTETTAAVRAHVRRSIARTFRAEWGSQPPAVVSAILIGDRAGLDVDTEQRLRQAGTYHVVAISGGNIAILAALAFFAVRTVVRPHRAATGAAIVLVAAYGSIVAGEPSVARATLAACVYLSARLAGFAVSALHVLGAVALVLAVLDPLIVLDAGAWLSFVATAAIVMSADRLVTLFVGADVDPSLATRAWRAGATIVAATVAADLALLPIAASVFAQVSVAGLALNLVAIPAMTIVQIAGMASVALASVSERLAAPAAHVAHWGAVALLESARVVDVLPWLSWRVPPPGLVMVVVYYAAAAWALIARHGRLALVARAFLMASVCVITTAPATSLAAPPAATLRIAVFDVGQGDATLVQFPGGQSLLVDAGGARGAFDVGDRIATPAIWALGVRRLDWLLVTHTDVDHVGGAPAVIRTFRPREVWEGVPVARDPEWRRVREAARATGFAWRVLQRGDRLEVNGAVLEVLHPPLPDWERPRTRNDDSLVIRLRYGDVEVLLLGDVGADVERSIDLSGESSAPLRVVKVAHHGSRTSSSPEFVRRYAPFAAIVSAGRGNPFGHPAPDVVGRFHDAGARLFRTDRHGAIVVETDGRALDITTATGTAAHVMVWR